MNRYMQEYKVQSCLCDNTNHLDKAACFGLFQDMAGFHASSLGLDSVTVEKKMGVYWVAAKTKIKFFKIPADRDEVNITTWPEKPKGLRCNRNYLMEQNGEPIIVGKTEWIVVDAQTKKPVRNSLFPEDFDFYDKTVFDDPFDKLKGGLEEEPYASYKVRSVDIDIAQHMNNVAYIRAIEGSFTSKEWETMDIQEIEAVYKTPCYEGDTLYLRKKILEDGLEITASTDDGEIFIAKLICNTNL